MTESRDKRKVRVAGTETKRVWGYCGRYSGRHTMPALHPMASGGQEVTTMENTRYKMGWGGELRKEAGNCAYAAVEGKYILIK